MGTPVFKQWWHKLFFHLYYWGNPPWDTGISPPELLKVIERYPPGRALDLGCGTGTNAITLAKHGWRVVGVDFVGKAIKRARRKAQNMGLNIEFLIEDVTRLRNVKGPFDLVLDIGCLHSLPADGKERTIRRLPDLLSDKGIFLLYAFFQDEHHPNGLNARDLSLLEQHLSLVERQNGTERGIRPSAWFTYRQRRASQPDKPLSGGTLHRNSQPPSG